MSLHSSLASSNNTLGGKEVLIHINGGMNSHNSSVPQVSGKTYYSKPENIVYFDFI